MLSALPALNLGIMAETPTYSVTNTGANLTVTNGGQIHVGDNNNSHHHYPQDRTSKSRTIAQRLKYDDISGREDFLEKKGNRAAPGTYEWLLTARNSTANSESGLDDVEAEACRKYDEKCRKARTRASNDFKAFLTADNPDRGHQDRVFGIYGKPGSGKSTLMHYLTRNDYVVVRRDLRTWAGKLNRTLVMGKFFFSVVRGGLQTTTQGLHRTLLSHILEQHSEGEREALEEALFPGEKKDNTFGPIKDISVELASENWVKVAENSSSRCFCFFVDALDEFEPDAEDESGEPIESNEEATWAMVQELKKWARSRYVKLICSSRESERRIRRTLNTTTGHTLRLHDYTRGDVFRAVIQKFRCLEEYRPHQQTFVQGARKITDGANGIFLWARLVSSQLLQAVLRAKNVDDKLFHNIMKTTPKGLNNLYEKILKKIMGTDDEENKQADLLLRLATLKPDEFELNALVVCWLQELVHEPDFPFHTKPAKYSKEQIDAKQKKASERIEVLAQGLLGIQRSPRYDYFSPSYRSAFEFTIVPLHRTSHEFLRTKYKSRDDGNTGFPLKDWWENDMMALPCKDPSQNLLLRIVTAEMRLFMDRCDGLTPEEVEENPNQPARPDIMDFGFWRQGAVPHMDSITKLMQYRGFHLLPGRAYSAVVFSCICAHEIFQTYSRFRWRATVFGPWSSWNITPEPPLYTLIAAQGSGHLPPAEMLTELRRPRNKPIPRVVLARLVLHLLDDDGRAGHPVELTQILFENGEIRPSDLVPVEPLHVSLDRHRHQVEAQLWLVFLHLFFRCLHESRKEGSRRGLYQILERWLQHGAEHDAVIIATTCSVPPLGLTADSGHVIITDEAEMRFGRRRLEGLSEQSHDEIPISKIFFITIRQLLRHVESREGAKASCRRYPKSLDMLLDPPVVLKSSRVLDLRLRIGAGSSARTPKRERVASHTANSQADDGLLRKFQDSLPLKKFPACQFGECPLKDISDALANPRPEHFREDSELRDENWRMIGTASRRQGPGNILLGDFSCRTY